MNYDENELQSKSIEKDKLIVDKFWNNCFRMNFNIIFIDQ